MSLAAGRRNKRIEIQRAAQERNELNEPVERWTAYARPWADVIYGSGVEQRAAAQADATQAASFEILHNSKTRRITVTDRVSFDGGIWDIKAVATMGVNEGIRISAIRQVP